MDEDDRRIALELRVGRFYAHYAPEKLRKNKNLAAETVLRWTQVGKLHALIPTLEVRYGPLPRAGPLPMHSSRVSPGRRGRLWEGVTMVGTLWKRSRWVKEWRSRFFVLRGSQLECYLDRSAYAEPGFQPTPRLTINLRGGHVHPHRKKWQQVLQERPHSFVVHTGEGRHEGERVFLAASISGGTAAMNRWVEAIADATLISGTSPDSSPDASPCPTLASPLAMRRIRSSILFRPFGDIHEPSRGLSLMSRSPQETPAPARPLRPRRPSLSVQTASEHSALRRLSAGDK